MTTFNVKVKWNKETYDLELNTTETPNVFKAQIFGLTGVSPERQKVMFKGSVIKDDEWNPATLKVIKNGATFLMMGSCEELPEVPKDKVVFMEDMNENELASAMDLPAGLFNLGNTCYLNATIQCLLTVPELCECLKNHTGTASLGESFDGSHDIVAALRDVNDKMGNTAAVMPIILLEMLHIMFPQFAEKGENGLFAQQDANECWSELVKVLQQKLKIKAGDSAADFIGKYFGGQFVSKMTCKDNDQEEATTSTESFLQLSCFISQDVKYLHSGLKSRLEEEIVKQSPTLNRDAHYLKSSKISRLPAYLTINFVRFFYKEKNAINAKILKDVKFPMNLDLFDLCTPELQVKLQPMRQKFKELEDSKVERAQKAVEKDAKKTYYPFSFEDDTGSNNSGLYTLNAVLTHKGRSSSSGHYVGWIKKNDQWFKCDDDKVSPVHVEDVLKLSGGGDWHCAYVLLYAPQLIEKTE